MTFLHFAFQFCMEGWIFDWQDTDCTICMKYALFMNEYLLTRESTGDASDRGGRKCQEFEFYRGAAVKSSPFTYSSLGRC